MEQLVGLGRQLECLTIDRAGRDVCSGWCPCCHLDCIADASDVLARQGSATDGDDGAIDVRRCLLYTSDAADDLQPG